MSNRAAGIVIRASSFLRHCSFRHSSFFHVYLSDSNFAVTYDDGGRVTTWNRDDNHSPPGYGGEQTWTYDDAGNWNSTKIGGSTQNRNHDASDQLTSLGGTSLNYTLNGNLSKDHHNNQYSWDIDNRLSAKTNDGQALGTADYKYDVLGRRVGKDSGGGSAGIVVTLWWNMREIADYETSGTNPDAIHHYINMPRHNDRLARTVQVGNNEKVQYYHKNYLDHVYAITDEDGKALEYIRYSAFGIATFYDFSGLKVANSPTGNQFTWNAKRLDPHLGWYVYHYRHYSPELGRWPSRDPIEEHGGVNLYEFVGNGPLYDWDLLGREVAGEEAMAADIEAMINAVHEKTIDAHKATETEFLNQIKRANPRVTDPHVDGGRPYLPKMPREYGGRVCEKCEIVDEKEVYSYYLTLRKGPWPASRIGASIWMFGSEHCARGDKLVAWWHTHPSALVETLERGKYKYYWRGGDSFSGKDKEVWANKDQNPDGLPHFVTYREGISTRQWRYATDMFPDGSNVRLSPDVEADWVDHDDGKRMPTY